VRKGIVFRKATICDMKLEWNVFNEDYNRKQITILNIFNHSSFLRDCILASKTCKTCNEFSELVKRSLRYYFGTKCEWEIILSCWPPSSKFSGKKVDVYDQVMLNWDRFIEYLWSNKEELKSDKNI
jgi:hypothetical protein